MTIKIYIFKKQQKRTIVLHFKFQTKNIDKDFIPLIVFPVIVTSKILENRNNSENVKVFPNVHAPFSLLHKYSNYRHSY